MAEQQVTRDVEPGMRERRAYSSRSRHSRQSRIKILLLSVSLGVLLLVLLVVSIYSTAKISSLRSDNLQLERSLLSVQDELQQLVPQLEQKRNELSELVQDRFPNLQPLVVNRVLKVDKGLIKNVLFTRIKQGNEAVYKYLLVAENATTEKINPSFRVLLFDDYGVHIGSADVVDKQVLDVGESRDYTDQLELFFDALPKHFYVEDLSARYSEK